MNPVNDRNRAEQWQNGKGFFVRIFVKPNAVSVCLQQHVPRPTLLCLWTCTKHQLDHSHFPLSFGSFLSRLSCCGSALTKSQMTPETTRSAARSSRASEPSEPSSSPGRAPRLRLGSAIKRYGDNERRSMYRMYDTDGETPRRLRTPTWDPDSLLWREDFGANHRQTMGVTVIRSFLEFVDECTLFVDSGLNSVRDYLETESPTDLVVQWGELFLSYLSTSAWC